MKVSAQYFSGMLAITTTVVVVISSLLPLRVDAEEQSEPVPAETYAVPAEIPMVKAVEGLLMGQIYWISKEQKAIVLTPEGERKPRRKIYFDRYTRFKQEKTELSLKELEIGDRVAVWYVGEGDLLLADKIYYVTDEFEREKYLPKSRRVSPADREIPGVKHEK